MSILQPQHSDTSQPRFWLRPRYSRYSGTLQPQHLDTPQPRLWLRPRYSGTSQPRLWLHPRYSDTSQPRLWLRPRYSDTSQPWLWLRPRYLSTIPSRLWLRPRISSFPDYQTQRNFILLAIHLIPLNFALYIGFDCHLTVCISTWWSAMSTAWFLIPLMPEEGVRNTSFFFRGCTIPLWSNRNNNNFKKTMFDNNVK